MAFFEKNKDKIWSKYTLKRTKLHRGGGMPPNMQIPKSEKKNSWPPPLPNPGDAPVVVVLLRNEWITATSNSRETLALTANMDVILIDVINIVYQIIVHLIK